jgi:hypothetical protein
MAMHKTRLRRLRQNGDGKATDQMIESLVELTKYLKTEVVIKGTVMLMLWYKRQKNNICECW